MLRSIRNLENYGWNYELNEVLRGKSIRTGRLNTLNRVILPSGFDLLKKLKQHVDSSDQNKGDFFDKHLLSMILESPEEPKQKASRQSKPEVDFV